MVNDLATLVQKTGKKYLSTLDNCLKWFLYFKDKTPLSEPEQRQCYRSYLMQENLMMFHRQGNECFLDLAFPHLFPVLESELKECVEGVDYTKLLNHPILCGLIRFEQEFLQHQKLSLIELTAVTPSTEGCTPFTFTVKHPYRQEVEAPTKMTINQFYHLQNFDRRDVCLSISEVKQIVR